MNKYDQFFQYKELWGDEYGYKVESLWENHIQLFKKGELPDSSWQETTLIISFDYYLGASVGLPEDIKLKFYNWLIAGMRRQLGYEV